MTPETLSVPIIHLNGTSADSLVEGYLDAFRALHDARLKLMETAPNGRDFYVQETGAFVKARDQHMARVAGITKAMDDLQTLANEILRQHRSHRSALNTMETSSSRTAARNAIEAHKATDKRPAVDAMIEQKASFDAAIKRLQTLSDDHFNTDPSDANWGDVGTVGAYNELLTRITDMAFNEGDDCILDRT